MKTFKINDFLTLKLEYGFTNIYVKDTLFTQCKYLILQKKSTELDDLLKIRSIDELELENEVEEEYDLEELDDEIFPNIDPKTAFWAHCSNLQVWVEHNYDTRLLHSNLSFPLLKRLWQLEEPSAKIVFQEEIIRRFREGYINTVFYLLQEGYHNFLNKEDLKQILLDQNDNLREEIKECLKTKKNQDCFKIALFLLEDLSHHNDRIALKFLKEFILDSIEKNNLKVTKFLCKWDFFKEHLFTKNELVQIIYGIEPDVEDLKIESRTKIEEYLRKLIYPPETLR
jgi:hypothetical protein